MEANGEVRVPFDGDRALTLEHAAAMLAAMYEDNRPLFGYYLAKGITSEAPKGPRGGG